MIVDNEFDLSSSSSDVSNKSIGIDNQGSMQINGKFQQMSIMIILQE